MGLLGSIGAALGIDSAIQSIKDAAGLLSPIVNTKPGSALPWDISNVQSRFFYSINIDPNRWDQLFPYRLMVIDSRNNKVVNGTSGVLNPPKVTVVKGTGSTTIVFENNGGWIYTLPITPQQLSITDQYAINTTATIRGVLEEHGGLRFKLIQASGSMGVWPQRESVNHPPVSPGPLASVFGGTLEAIGNVVGQVQKVINTATTNHPANKPKTTRPEASGPTSTGYYQAMKLQQFLEQYAEAKRDPNNAHWRLVFDIPKQNTSYIVTPLAFVWSQNANKPMEIQYSWQLKAWRRINLSIAKTEVQADNQPISPGILQRIMNTIREARKTMSASYSLIQAVRSDVDAPLEALRQTALFVKDMAGVAITAADLPSQIGRDYSSAIQQFHTTLKTISLDADVSNDPTVVNSLKEIRASSARREGLSTASVRSGQLGRTAYFAQATDPVNNIYANPSKYFTLMDIVPVNSLALTPAQRSKVNDIVNNARFTTVDDLKKNRAVIADLASQLSDNFGAGSSFVNSVYGKPAPKTRTQAMTVDEFDILKTLYEVMQSIDILTATKQVDELAKQAASNQVENSIGSGSKDTGGVSGNPNMDYVAGLAAQAGILFETPSAKILSPVPFGLSIEQIAARYLGNPERWLEIATLNNLSDPYIDEDGFQLALLSNASGRQVTVNSVENLYEGQRVVLTNSTLGPTARAILGISRLSDASYLLTLDGAPDLDNYTLADGSYIQAYLPGTVNSQQKILIPSDVPTVQDSGITPPASTANDPLTGLSKVDWLLTDSGDLARNSYGDFRYASGLTNIIQALRIKVGTTQGRVLTHPNFGLGIQPGLVNSDLKIQDVYESLNQMIAQDPRFQGLSSLQIGLSGPTLSISMGVTIVGQQGVFPVSFDVKS